MRIGLLDRSEPQISDELLFTIHNFDHMIDNSSGHIQHVPLKKPNGAESLPGINGLILSGGESKRMGRDKGSINYHGMSQIDFLSQFLIKFVERTYISCHPDRIPVTKHEVLPDTFLNLGPYGGVLSAFRHDPDSAWLVVACDIPMLDESVITHLINERDPNKVATCIHDPSTGLPEPLITIWEPRAYPILLHFLSQGISCLRKTLIHTDVKQIDIDRPEVLMNVNTPEEANNVREMLKTLQREINM